MDLALVLALVALASSVAGSQVMGEMEYVTRVTYVQEEGG